MYFQIEGSSVRLGGSMHAVPKGRPLAAWVDDAIGWSRSIYLEHEESDWERLARLPEGQSVGDRIPRSWRRIAALPNLAPALSFRTPSYIAMFGFFNGVSFDPGVERTVKARARYEGKNIEYLETATEVSELADAVPDAVWDEAVTWVLDHPAAGKQVTDGLYAAWIAGDVDTVDSITRRGLAQFTEIREAWITSRNSLWLPVIRRLITSALKPTLILPGAAHLGGSDGLVPQLRASGLRLMPLA